MASSNDLILLPILNFLFRSILHDPKAFNNPMEYQPERYLKDGELNPDVMNLDSGIWLCTVDPKYSTTASFLISLFPRICPGRHFSDNSLYLIVSCLLAVYDIKPPVDDQGNITKLKPASPTDYCRKTGCYPRLKSRLVSEITWNS